LLINPGTVDFSTGPSAVSINAGVLSVVTPGYYNVHFNVGLTIANTTAGDIVALRLIGNNVTQNITISKVLTVTGTEDVCFNASLF